MTQCSRDRDKSSESDKLLICLRKKKNFEKDLATMVSRVFESQREVSASPLLVMMYTLLIGM